VSATPAELDCMAPLLDVIEASVTTEPYEPCVRCEYLHRPGDLTDGLCQGCVDDVGEIARRDRW
jgi:hypothetical protein